MFPHPTATPHVLYPPLCIQPESILRNTRQFIWQVLPFQPISPPLPGKNKLGPKLSPNLIRKSKIKVAGKVKGYFSTNQSSKARTWGSHFIWRDNHLWKLFSQVVQDCVWPHEQTQPMPLHQQQLRSQQTALKSNLQEMGLPVWTGLVHFLDRVTYRRG